MHTLQLDEGHVVSLYSANFMKIKKLILIKFVGQNTIMSWHCYSESSVSAA